MSKVDLSDGFYRLWLRPEDTHRLVVLFPSRKNEPTLVGIPLTNPMGWVFSAQKNLACTETVCDMVNVDLKNVESMRHTWITLHRLDVVSETRPADDRLDILSETSGSTKFGISTCTGTNSNIANINFLTIPGSDLSRSEHDQNPVVVSRTDPVPKLV